MEPSKRKGYLANLNLLKACRERKAEEEEQRNEKKMEEEKQRNERKKMVDHLFYDVLRI